MNIFTTRGRMRSVLLTTGATLAVSTLVVLSALGGAVAANAEDIAESVEVVEQAEIVESTEVVETTESAEPVEQAEAAESSAPAELTDPAAAAGPAPVANDDLFSGTAGSTDLAPSDLYLNDTMTSPTSIEIDDPAGQVALVNGWISVPIAGGFSGTRTFQYRTTGPAGISNWATVSVVVLAGVQQPIAYDDFYATTNTSALAILAPGVMANDDAAGGSVTGLIDPAGEVLIQQDGTFEYNPALGFIGVKTFYYQVTANGLPSNWGKVSITVTAGAAPAAPVAVDDSYQTAQGVDLDVPAKGLLLNDSSSTAGIFDWDDSTGEITLTGNGALHYTPAAGFSGVKSFKYRIAEAGEVSNWATVTINVTAPAGPAAPIAVDDKYTVDMDTTLNVSAPGVLANDSSGIVWWTGGFYPGTLVMNFNGSFSYQPDPGFTGTVVIDYTMRDNTTESNVATITIEVVDPQLPTLGGDEPAGVISTTDTPGILAFTGIGTTWLALPAASIVLLGALALGFSVARRRSAGSL